MHFYINILTTYYPDLDPPYDVYYQQILEQIELAEELGWECFMFNEHHFLGYGGLDRQSGGNAGDRGGADYQAFVWVLALRFCRCAIRCRRAEDYAMVDADIRRYDLEFGIGSGNTPMDYQVFDIAREKDRRGWRKRWR